MYSRTLACVLCALTIACGANAPTSPTPAPSPPSATTVTLTGHVFDADSGAPLVGANIYILQGVNRGGYAQADDRGMFTLANLTPGQFTIEVVASAHDAIQRDLTVTTDTALDFPLTRIVPRVFVLSGRVTDISSGAPLAGASITVLDGASAGRTTTSNIDGTFRLTDVIFGGLTFRVRSDGYDSVFRSVIFVADTSADIQMRRARETLAGTWAGGVSYSSSGAGSAIPELTITQSGASITGTFPNGVVLFRGILGNPSAISSTTEITGTMTLSFAQGGRVIVSCTGTGNFAGTVNWARLVITAPQVVFPCAPAYNNVTIALTRQQ